MEGSKNVKLLHRGVGAFVGGTGVVGVPIGTKALRCQFGRSKVYPFYLCGPKMQIFVRAAHFSNRSYYSRSTVRHNIVKYTNIIDSKIAVRALKALEKPKEGGRDSIYYLEKLYDDCSAKDREILQRCLFRGFCLKVVRPSVKLRVEPTITLGAVKSMLKPVPWSPSENIVLVQRKEIPLDDDSSTLEEAGIKDRESLLVCMGGSYELTVHDGNNNKDFVIPIDSCFESVGDVKEKIREKTGHRPEDQELSCGLNAFKKEETPLVALGVVRPYMKEMWKHIDMFIPKLFKSSLHQIPDLV